jgi:hypothetical protein
MTPTPEVEAALAWFAKGQSFVGHDKSAVHGRTLYAAYRAQAERVEALEKERDDAKEGAIHFSGLVAALQAELSLSRGLVEAARDLKATAELFGVVQHDDPAYAAFEAAIRAYDEKGVKP